MGIVERLKAAAEQKEREKRAQIRPAMQIRLGLDFARVREIEEGHKQRREFSKRALEESGIMQELRELSTFVGSFGIHEINRDTSNVLKREDLSYLPRRILQLDQDSILQALFWDYQFFSRPTNPDEGATVTDTTLQKYFVVEGRFDGSIGFYFEHPSFFRGALGGVGEQIVPKQIWGGNKAALEQALEHAYRHPLTQRETSRYEHSIGSG